MVIAQRSMPRQFRLIITYNEENPTDLTDAQIENLQKFSAFLKTPVAEKYVTSSENFLKVLFVIIIIVIIILYIIHAYDYLSS